MPHEHSHKAGPKNEQQQQQSRTEIPSFSLDHAHFKSGRSRRPAQPPVAQGDIFSPQLGFLQMGQIFLGQCLNGKSIETAFLHFPIGAAYAGHAHTTIHRRHHNGRSKSARILYGHPQKTKTTSQQPCPGQNLPGLCLGNSFVPPHPLEQPEGMHRTQTGRVDFFHLLLQNQAALPSLFLLAPMNKTGLEDLRSAQRQQQPCDEQAQSHSVNLLRRRKAHSQTTAQNRQQTIPCGDKQLNHSQQRPCRRRQHPFKAAFLFFCLFPGRLLNS